MWEGGRKEVGQGEEGKGEGEGDQRKREEGGKREVDERHYSIDHPFSLHQVVGNGEGVTWSACRDHHPLDPSVEYVHAQI